LALVSEGINDSTYVMGADNAVHAYCARFRVHFDFRHLGADVRDVFRIRIILIN
jgi:hypothetical protein